MDLTPISELFEKQFEANKTLWNNRVASHLDTELYDLENFKKGKCSLNNIELEVLPDVDGKSMLHIQCHFGQDSISWARRGAKVTGTDISEDAIQTARQLSRELDANCEFIVSNTYDLPKNHEGQYDIVFASYGVIGWLPDMDELGKVVSQFVKPGGKFVLVEFHPVVWMFNDDFTALTYPYNNFGMLEFETSTTYADDKIELESRKEYNWNHGLGEVINGMTKAGLTLKQLKEYDYSPYRVFPNMFEVENGYQIEGYDGIIPMVYALEMEKSS